jgi:hypothetical protein
MAKSAADCKIDLRGIKMLLERAGASSGRLEGRSAMVCLRTRIATGGVNAQIRESCKPTIGSIHVM